MWYRMGKCSFEYERESWNIYLTFPTLHHKVTKERGMLVDWLSASLPIPVWPPGTTHHQHCCSCTNCISVQALSWTLPGRKLSSNYRNKRFMPDRRHFHVIFCLCSLHCTWSPRAMRTPQSEIECSHSHSHTSHKVIRTMALDYGKHRERNALALLQHLAYSVAPTLHIWAWSHYHFTHPKEGLY